MHLSIATHTHTRYLLSLPPFTIVAKTMRKRKGKVYRNTYTAMLYYYSICSAPVCKAELKLKAFNYRNLKNGKKQNKSKQRFIYYLETTIYV